MTSMYIKDKKIIPKKHAYYNNNFILMIKVLICSKHHFSELTHDFTETFASPVSKKSDL